MSANQARKMEKVLSPTEVAGLEREISEAEQMQRETDSQYTPSGAGSGRHDPNALSATNDPNIARYKRVLMEGKPGSVGHRERVLREKQMEKDKEWLQKMMVPRSHVTLKASPDPEFRKAVNFMAKMEMSTEFQTVAQRYKNNARLLHPDSPELSNIESIRPDKN